MKTGSDGFVGRNNDPYFSTLLSEVGAIEHDFGKFIPDFFPRRAFGSDMTKRELYEMVSSWRDVTDAIYRSQISRKSGSDSKPEEKPVFLKPFVIGGKTYMADPLNNYAIRDIFYSDGPGAGVSFYGLLADVPHVWGRGELKDANQDLINGVAFDGK